MPWYWYKQGGWEIAVDAVSKQDAAQYIKRAAPGAVYRGEAIPPSWRNPSMATAMTTAKRQEIIHAKVEEERRQWIREGRPGAWWDAPKEEGEA